MDEELAAKERAWREIAAIDDARARSELDDAGVAPGDRPTSRNVWPAATDWASSE